jgi:hypothetical protein
MTKMKTNLKKALLYTAVIVSLVFTACSAQTGETTTTTTSGSTITTSNFTITASATLPTGPSANTLPENAVPLEFPDNGILHCEGKYFYFQRVFDSIDEPTYYRGVIFAPKDWGGITPTGPIAYWFKVYFADGTDEELMYVGLGDENQVDFTFTKHDNPKAGVMLAFHVVGGSLSSVIYLLVSEQL